MTNPFSKFELARKRDNTLQTFPTYDEDWDSSPFPFPDQERSPSRVNLANVFPQLPFLLILIPVVVAAIMYLAGGNEAPKNIPSFSYGARLMPGHNYMGDIARYVPEIR